jgi:hypothetical protein
VVDLLEFGDLFYLTWLYWVAAGPVALAVTARWYRRYRLRDGAGPGEGDIVLVAVLTGCAAVVGAFLSLGGVVTAAGFLAVALARRIRIFAVAAAVSGVVIGLEQPFHALSNVLANAYPRLPVAHLLDQHGPTIVLTLLGPGLATVGGLILRQERSGAR